MPSKKKSSPEADEVELLAQEMLDSVREDDAQIREAASAVRQALVTLLGTVSGVVESNRQSAEAMRAAGAEELADFVETFADLWAEVVGEDFQRAAGEVVGAVVGAVYLGHPGHVEALAERLRGPRQRPTWAYLCSRHWELLRRFSRLGARYAEQVAGTLCRTLASVDPAAEELTPKHVLAAVESTDCPSGFAGRLAVDCHAFGYTSQESAQKAFARYV